MSATKARKVSMIGLLTAAVVAIGYLSASAQLKTPVPVVMYLSPTCGCCRNYAGYLESMGFEVKMIPARNLEAIKDRLGVPGQLRSCHTMVIGRYYVEGHVPAEVITRLLQRKPEIMGIALAGMPPGSPGMGGRKKGLLVVYAVGKGRVEEFARF